jgi:signal transduction histidine kinase
MVAVGLQTPLWRAIAAFRFASLAYAAVLLAVNHAQYSHPLPAGAILAAMTAWTAATSIAYSSAPKRTPALLTADLVVTGAALLSTALVQYTGSVRASVMPLTATWVAGPVLAWAVAFGVRGGVAAAFALSACDIALRRLSWPAIVHGSELDSAVLLLLAGVGVGYLSRLARRAELALQHATQIEAASRERERLARGIHDSVLQVLALVQRRGAEAGGEAAEIGRLAGEQEAALRNLIAGGAGPPSDTGELDIRNLLASENTAVVSVVTPAEPVRLAAGAARELASAVRAALDNVRQHCAAGTRAWVLVEQEGGQVMVTVRDDGPGIPPGRLAEAASDGRLGVSHAICGRARELGGSATISSAPGTGTEVRLQVPAALTAASVPHRASGR